MLKGGQVRVEEIKQRRKDQQNCLVQRYASEKKWDILSTVVWMVVFVVFGQYKSILKYCYGEVTKCRRKLNTRVESLGYWRENTLNLGAVENGETRDETLL